MCNADILKLQQCHNNNVSVLNENIPLLLIKWKFKRISLHLVVSDAESFDTR